MSMMAHLTLRSMEGARVEAMGSSKAGRLLQSIHLDMKIKAQLFRTRLRNEEILAISYQDGYRGGSQQSGVDHGGGMSYENARQNLLNIPYKYDKWLKGQATSKKMVVKINRDAGPGQKPGGPGDEQTAMWRQIMLQKLAYKGGFKREINKVIGEVVPRGTSVLRVGFHEEAITPFESEEVGKDPEAVMMEVLQRGDLEAKRGQDHAEISAALGAMAQDGDLQKQVGMQGVQALLARKASHDEMARKSEADESPTESTRMTRRQIYLRKLRVGEDVGWAPWVTDSDDKPWWWERHVWTVAQVKGSPNLFKREFRRMVEGVDSRATSAMTQSGRTVASDTMGSDARHAQADQILDEDERMVEWFRVWFRRPDMQSGGYCRIVAPEMPDEFVEADDGNPHFDRVSGNMMIEDFYPFFDFTPIESSLQIPESTCGIPPMAVAMSQVEKLAEYNRIRQEAALKGATRIHQIHPGLKDKRGILKAIKNGEVGYAFIAPDSIMTNDGKMEDAVRTIDFSSRHPEIEKQAAMEKVDALNMLGMPPAIYQGMGTAETLGQDQLGVASGEQGIGDVVEYFQERMADVLKAVQGIAKYSLDMDDFRPLLGEEGARVIAAWQAGTDDSGDQIEAIFGATLKAKENLDRKQLAEAIALEKSDVEPLTGIEKWDSSQLFEELHRLHDVGPPVPNRGVQRALQEKVVQFAKMVHRITGLDPLDPKQAQKLQEMLDPQPLERADQPSSGGPSPSEGSGPQMGTMNAGVQRGTLAATIPEGI